MNVGIVGANGFLGRELCKMFLSKKDKVFGIFRNQNSSIHHGVKKIHIDNIEKIKYDYLIITIGGHLSTHQEYLEQYNFIEFVIKKCTFKKIVYISSVEVYGKHSKTINIQSSFNNPNIYGLSKISQEFLIQSLPNYAIIRPTYLYGDGMNTNSLLPIWINKARKEKQIIVYGDGSRNQDYLHVGDLCNLCSVVLDSDKKGTLIAATGESISNINVANIIATAVGNTTISFYSEDKTLSSSFNISQTISDYNWSPQVKFKDWINSNPL